MKVLALSIQPEPQSNNGTMVSFRYEYQPEDLGLCLFTNQARWVTAIAMVEKPNGKPGIWKRSFVRILFTNTFLSH